MKSKLFLLIVVFVSLLSGPKVFARMTPVIFYDEGKMSIAKLQVSVYQNPNPVPVVGEMPLYLKFEFETVTGPTTSDFTLVSSDDESELSLRGLRTQFDTGGPSVAHIHRLNFLWVPRFGKFNASGSWTSEFPEGVPTKKSIVFGKNVITATFTKYSLTDRPGMGFKIENVVVAPI